MELREPSAKYLVRPGYRQTEVGVIPEDWEVASLGAVCNITAGGDLIRSEFSDCWSEKHKYPIYANALKEGGLYGYSSTAHSFTEAVTVTARGDIGHATYRASGFCAIGRLLVLTAQKPCDLRFLAECINERIAFALESTGVPQLTVPQISKYLLGLPSQVGEQRAIADALGDADALIESLEHLLAKQRLLRQATMQALLTGERRLPGFEGGWESRALGDLGRWVGGMTPSMSNPDYWEPPAIPWISSGDVKTSRLSSTGSAISQDAAQQYPSIVMPAGSIVVVVRSGILRNYFPVAMTMQRMAINQDLKAIIPSKEIVGDFLLHALRFNGDAILARCLKSGTTVESIEFPWLKGFEIPLPPLAEQTAIATALSDLDAEIAALEARIAKARQVKQGMMQELLTGRIRLV